MLLEHPIRVLISAWSRYVTVKFAHDIGFRIRKGNRTLNFSKICVFIISPPYQKKKNVIKLFAKRTLFQKVIYRKFGKNIHWRQLGKRQHQSQLGQWFSPVGWVVASDTRGPGFESSHQQFLLRTYFNCQLKKRIKKRGLEWSIKKNETLVTSDNEKCFLYAERPVVVVIVVAYDADARL